MTAPTRKLPSIGGILRPAGPPPQPAEEPTKQAAEPTPAAAKSPPKRPPSTPPVAPPAPAPAAQVDPAWDVTNGSVPVDPLEQVYLVPRQVYLPRSTHARAKAYASESGIPVTEMIVTALSDMHSALPAYLRQERAQEQGPAGDLYPIPQRIRRNRHPDRHVQTSIRITDQQLTVMDRLAQRYGVNRSKLLATCLQLWLAERTPAAAN